MYTIYQNRLRFVDAVW